MRSVFLTYGTPLTAVPPFKYLGRILLSTDDNWTVVEQNLLRARNNLVRTIKILGREGSEKRTAGKFYVAVVQAVLLSGSETCAVTPRLEKALVGFHHQAVCQMVGMGPERQLNGTWVYPPIETALMTVGI